MNGPRQGVVAIIQRETRMLVIQRSALVRAPLAYCFPGGGVEWGESEDAALRRELLEELGVAIEPLRCVWHCRTRSDVELSWWTAKLSDPGAPLRPSADEVATYMWLETADILALPNLLETNQRFLQELLSGAIQL
jgi:8-oxo-dGTP pyrophosphatase MutT (NUDIX family)